MTNLSDFLNADVSRLAKARSQPITGDLFGIELECEGVRVDYDGHGVKGWTPHNDGSLRNHHGSSCEWVFVRPVNYPTSVALVGALFAYFKKRDARLVCSNRTSMHVHYNMGDKAGYQVVNLYVLFTILEGLLDRYCGEDREGNLFCLSSRHASDQVTWVEEACFKYNSFLNLRENNRYCSFNMASLNKFFSVEFRGMRGLDNEADILAWLSILNELTQFACYTMKNPVTVVEDISKLTPLGFLKTVFSKDNFNRLTSVMRTPEEISDSIYEGLRLVQRLVYRVGGEFDKVQLRKKDFWAETGKELKSEKKIEWKDIDFEADVEAVAPRPGLRNGRIFRPAEERRAELPPLRWGDIAGRGVRAGPIDIVDAGRVPPAVDFAEVERRVQAVIQQNAVRNPFNEEEGNF